MTIQEIKDIAKIVANRSKGFKKLNIKYRNELIEDLTCWIYEEYFKFEKRGYILTKKQLVYIGWKMIAPVKPSPKIRHKLIKIFPDENGLYSI